MVYNINTLDGSITIYTHLDATALIFCGSEINIIFRYGLYKTMLNCLIIRYSELHHMYNVVAKIETSLKFWCKKYNANGSLFTIGACCKDIYHASD